VHRYPIRVRYGDTDQMGFAYYAHYLRWFEIGRAEMLRSLGRSYRDVERDGASLPVLEAHCRYLSPARYDDALTLETGVLQRSRASVRFGYRVVRDEDGALLAHGWTEHCFMNPAGKPVRPPATLAAMLERAPRAAPVVETPGT
jgi:acyl-CoA thioester hydrolase